MRLNLRSGKICSSVADVNIKSATSRRKRPQGPSARGISAVALLAALISFPAFIPAKGPHITTRLEEDPTTTTLVAGVLDAIDPATGQAKNLLHLDHQSLGAPVVMDGTLYVSSSAKTLYAIEIATGKTKWEHAAEKPFFRLLATAKSVFVGVGGMLEALDPATGKSIWTYENDVPVSDAVLADDLIVFNTFDGPIAIDQREGKLRWKLDVQWGYFVFSPLTERRLCVWKPDEIMVVDTESGKTLWQSAAGRNMTAPGALPSPAVARGDIICQLRGSAKDSQDWSLHALDAGSGNELWKTSLGDHHTSSAHTVISADAAYCVLDDEINALDLRTGENRWHATTKPLEAGGAGLLSGNGLLYIPELGGDIVALDAKTGQRKWLSPVFKPAAQNKIRFGGIAASKSTLYVTRNESMTR